MFKRFLLVVIPLVFLVSFTVFALAALVRSARIDELVKDDQHFLAKAEAMLRIALHSADSDLGVIAGLGAMTETAGKPGVALSEAADIFLLIAREKQVYDQIRFLDTQGQEIIRADCRDGVVRLVPPEELQNKRSRYYFRDAMSLVEGQVAVSALDLNVERGQVEVPFRPMLRFSTPVYKDNERIGVAVLNYSAGILLEQLRGEFDPALNGRFMLLNEEGFRLIHPDRSREWGFMIEERHEETLANEDPQLWAEMSRSEEFAVFSDSGLTVGRTVSPFFSEDGHDNVFYRNARTGNGPLSPVPPKMMLVSMVDCEQLNSLCRSSYIYSVLIALLLSVLVAFAVWEIFRRREERRAYLHEVRHRALYDALSGLMRREALFDHMTKMIARVRRGGEGFAFLYLDLDGFKAINDHYGHLTGDLLIQQLGRNLSAGMRQSDLLARLGGDEFAVVIEGAQTRETVGRVAGKINELIRQTCEELQLRLKVTASIGTVFCPADAMEPQMLLHLADASMYKTKQAGRDRIVFHGNNKENGAVRGNYGEQNEPDRP